LTIEQTYCQRLSGNLHLLCPKFKHKKWIFWKKKMLFKMQYLLIIAIHKFLSNCHTFTQCDISQNAQFCFIYYKYFWGYAQWYFSSRIIPLTLSANSSLPKKNTYNKASICSWLWFYRARRKYLDKEQNIYRG
jgi:hypothetical protein